MRARLKEEIVSKLHDEFKEANFVILSNFSGLNVETITSLRKTLRDASTDYQVVKNSLTKRAVKNTGIEALDPYFVGPTAVALSQKDPLVSCKALIKFVKNHPLLQIKVGILDGKILAPQEVEELANLPAREVLIGKILFLFTSPQVNLLNVLNGIPQKLVQALEAICNQKQSNG